MLELINPSQGIDVSKTLKTKDSEGGMNRFENCPQQYNNQTQLEPSVL